MPLADTYIYEFDQWQDTKRQPVVIEVNRM